MLVLSYLTQVSYGWYAEFFQTLKTLEARGVAVYPSAEFKEFISSKASYMQLLQEQGRRVCPTQILHRSECVGVSGGGAAGGTSEISASEISAARVEVRMRAALTALGLLAPSGDGAPCQLVRKLTANPDPKPKPKPRPKRSPDPERARDQGLPPISPDLPRSRADLPREQVRPSSW